MKCLDVVTVLYNNDGYDLAIFLLGRTHFRAKKVVDFTKQTNGEVTLDMPSN